jgi:hypothetical protein
MITLYLWDEQGIYTGTADADDAAPMPERSTPTKPMKLTGTQVAQWQGGAWAKLSARPAVPEPELSQEPSAAEISKLYENAVQAKLDGAAQTARYDSIATAVSYAEEPAVPKFQADGRAFRTWRSLVWAYAYEQLAKVLAGEREQPTIDAFLLELPALEFAN